MNGKGIDGGFEGEIEGDSLRNWERSTILDVSEQIRGVTYSKSGACDISKNGYLPILRANNIQNDKLKFSDLVYVPETCVSKQQLLQPNDVVVAMSSGSASVVGKTAQIRHAWNGAFGAFCGVLRPSPHIEPRYFGLFLRSEEYRKKVSALSKGININNLKREHFQQIEMPVAPLNEQKRIADKLDQTLAIVERTKARLARVPEILKQFRQSVLAAATDGRLTEDWRIESGIIEEWEIVSLDSVVLDFSYGTSTKSTKTGKIPVLRMGNIQDGRLDWNDLVYTSDSLEIEKY